MVIATQLPYGAPIPGSRFFRAYCGGCDAPMRVPQSRLWALAHNGQTVRAHHWCNTCDPTAPPPPGTGLTPRQQIGSSKTKG